VRIDPTAAPQYAGFLSPSPSSPHASRPLKTGRSTKLPRKAQTPMAQRSSAGSGRPARRRHGPRRVNINCFAPRSFIRANSPEIGHGFRRGGFSAHEAIKILHRPREISPSPTKRWPGPSPSVVTFEASAAAFTDNALAAAEEIGEEGNAMLCWLTWKPFQCVRHALLVSVRPRTESNRIASHRVAGRRTFPFAADPAHVPPRIWPGSPVFFVGGGTFRRCVRRGRNQPTITFAAFAPW